MDNDDNNMDQEIHLRRKLEFVDDRQRIEAIRSEILDKTLPEVGMEFETEDEAYNFYNAYAYKIGFSVRRSKGYYNKQGKLINRIFCCSSQGFREQKKDAIAKCSRPETRFGCFARMKVDCRQTGKYKVVDFVAEHTHVITTPTKSHLHRSQRKVTLAQVAEIDLAESSGSTPKACCELMAKRAGGRESLGFTLED